MIHDASIALLEAANNSDPAPTGPSTLSTSEGVALVSNQGPDGVPSGDSIYTPAATQISTYMVKAGDTLSQIAQSYGVSVNTIVWANNLGSSKAIRPGETLVILPVSGVEHTVVKGDTLNSLAKKFGGSASDIAAFNGLDSSAPLSAGSVVIIPGGEVTSVAAAGSAGSSGKGATAANPYRGGSGPEIDDYYANPVPGDMVSQGLHGENAVDLAAPRGSLIHASAAGTIIVTRNNGAWNGGYGNYVVIAHDNGTETLYAHMITGSITVAPGQVVAQGDVIGKVGMTGDATGPHVHEEIRGAFNIFASCPVGSHPGEFTCQ